MSQSRYDRRDEVLLSGPHSRESCIGRGSSHRLLILRVRPTTNAFVLPQNRRHSFSICGTTHQGVTVRRLAPCAEVDEPATGLPGTPRGDPRSLAPGCASLRWFFDESPDVSSRLGFDQSIWRVFARLFFPTILGRMEPSERVQLRETCVVPCRLTASGDRVLPCFSDCRKSLGIPEDQHRFSKREFPSLLEQAAAVAGLLGDVQADSPLGQFDSKRGNEARSMIGYLMRVTNVAETWPQQSSYRRRWCLAEEARARIRRKPLRRFIDVALRLRGSAFATSHWLV